jgi:hypothetical protein
MPSPQKNRTYILIKILSLGGMETRRMFYYTYRFLNQSTKSINWIKERIIGLSEFWYIFEIIIQVRDIYESGQTEWMWYNIKKQSSLSVSGKEHYDYIYKKGFTSCACGSFFHLRYVSQKEIVYF